MAKIRVNNGFTPVVCPPVIISNEKLDVIKMSCGGGLGGSKWEELVECGAVNKQSENLVEVTDFFTRHKKIINTRFVVTAETKRVVAIGFDMTANVNFKSKFLHYYLIEEDDEIEIVPDNEKADSLRIIKSVKID